MVAAAVGVVDEVEDGSEVATVVVSDAEEEQVVIHATQHHT